MTHNPYSISKGPCRRNSSLGLGHGIVVIGHCLLLLLATSCALREPQVPVTPQQEFRGQRGQFQREPIILIPGTLGSRLFNRKTGEVAWGSFASTLSNLEDDLDLPISGPRLADNRDNLDAYRVLDVAEVLRGEGEGEIRFYAEVIDLLTTTLGYRASYGRRVLRGQDLFVFFYDWRRSNVEAAAQLGEFIASIRRDLQSPTMKFTLLGVSNGGLIARYYLRYGGADVVSGREIGAPLPDGNAGEGEVRRIVTLCTPHTGTLDALKLIHEGYAPAPLSRRHPPLTIFSMPATFELLPNTGQRLFVDSTGKPLDIDLWDAANWEKYGISVFSPAEKERLHYAILSRFNDDKDRKQLFEAEMEKRRKHLRLCLTHAARFKRAIAGVPAVPISCICGVMVPTLQRAALIPDGDEFEIIFEPRFTWRRSDAVVQAMLGMGDGVVTRRSALGEYLPDSAAALRKEGEGFRGALDGLFLTDCLHREMFDNALLKASLVEELTR